MKKLNVRIYLILQAAVSLLLPVFYFLSFRVSRAGEMISAMVNLRFSWLIGAAALAICALSVLRWRREKLDEFARSAVEKADTVCFRASLVMACLSLAVLFAKTILRDGPVMTADIIVYGGIVVCCVTALLVLRAVIFGVIDRKGML